MLVPLTASAVVVEGLFEVEMPIVDESKTTRRAALDDGLVEVLIRVSGDSHILDKIKVPAAAGYVQQFEYSTQENVQNADENQKLLWVRYNAIKIIDLLRQQAIPIWGERRNPAVIWLAVQDGNQRYILKDSDESLIKSKANEALNRRGIPVIWPKNDIKDQNLVRFADVWAGFAEPLKHVSKRYSTGPVISASMRWDGSAWKGEWTLLMDDEIKKWHLSGQDYAALISRATDLSADVMGQKYAILEMLDSSKFEQVTVEINRVESVESFRRIEKYLSSLSAVKSIQLLKVEQERVIFELTLRSKIDDLLNLIQSGKTMALLADDVSSEINAEAVDVRIPKNTNPDTAGSMGNDIASLPSKKEISYRFELR